LITVALSATIGASHERVWRALVDPSERPAWDERILGEIALSLASQRVRHQHEGRKGSTRTPAVNPALEAAAQSSRRSPEERAERAPSNRRTPIRTTRWRFRLGGVPLVMQDEVMTVNRHDRLSSRISIGSIHFDQTLTLHTEDDETGPRTRLGMKLVAGNSIAVIGEVVSRLDVQKIVIEYVDTTLRQVQKYCEAEA
jgi:uncharacterized protein YndB with AHSA1/START domain